MKKGKLWPLPLAILQLNGELVRIVGHSEWHFMADNISSRPGNTHLGGPKSRKRRHCASHTASVLSWNAQDSLSVGEEFTGCPGFLEWPEYFIKDIGFEPKLEWEIVLYRKTVEAVEVSWWWQGQAYFPQIPKSAMLTQLAGQQSTFQILPSNSPSLFRAGLSIHKALKWGSGENRSSSLISTVSPKQIDGDQAVKSASIHMTVWNRAYSPCFSLPGTWLPELRVQMLVIHYWLQNMFPAHTSQKVVGPLLQRRMLRLGHNLVIYPVS